MTFIDNAENKKSKHHTKIDQALDPSKLTKGEYAEETIQIAMEQLCVQKNFKDYYEILEKINAGTYSIVQKCRSIHSGEIYAVKFLKKKASNKKDKITIMNEIEINNKLDHVNIGHYL